jgi:hypothetical protein
MCTETLLPCHGKIITRFSSEHSVDPLSDTHSWQLSTSSSSLAPSVEPTLIRTDDRPNAVAPGFFPDFVG